MVGELTLYSLKNSNNIALKSLGLRQEDELRLMEIYKVFERVNIAS